MSKPTDQRKASETREGLWDAIRTLKEFTIHDLCLDAEMSKKCIQVYVHSLVAAKRLTIIGTRQTAGGPRDIYKLVRDSVETPRLRKDGTEVTAGEGRENIWRTIRMTRGKPFSLAELRTKATTARVVVSYREAVQYLRYLERAAVIRNTNNRPVSRAIYRLIKDLGPKTPIIQRIEQLYDPNTRKVIWPLPPSEAKR